MTRHTVLVLLVALAACGPAEPDPPVNPGVCGEHEIDSFAVGFTKQSAGGLELEVMDAVPLEPGEGFNNWELVISDEAGPREDLSLSFQPYMPDHEHGPAATTAVFEDAVYKTGDMDLFMPGYWEITATIDGGTEAADTAVFALCVE